MMSTLDLHSGVILLASILIITIIKKRERGVKWIKPINSAVISSPKHNGAAVTRILFSFNCPISPSSLFPLSPLSSLSLFSSSLSLSISLCLSLSLSFFSLCLLFLSFISLFPLSSLSSFYLLSLSSPLLSLSFCRCLSFVTCVWKHFPKITN